jgi:HD-like signal output (HDOD) protein
MRLGYDHAVLGELALRLWNFPERLASVVGMHHYIRAPESLDVETRFAIGVVALSDRIDQALQAGEQLSAIELAAVCERHMLTSMDPERLVSMADELGALRSEAMSEFGG